MATQGLAHWRQQGLLSLWRYIGANRSYQGWHICADAAGCQSLLALLDALPEESSAPYRTVSLSPPSPAMQAVPGRIFSGIETVAKLRLAYVASSTDWLFATSSNVATLTIGESWRIKLREAAIALSAGGGDFRVGPEDREQGIWFWWWRR